MNNGSIITILPITNMVVMVKDKTTISVTHALRDELRDLKHPMKVHTLPAVLRILIDDWKNVRAEEARQEARIQEQLDREEFEEPGISESNDPFHDDGPRELS